MRKIGIGILVLVISVLAFKFISWNFWKIQDAADTAQRIFRVPPAVNIVLSKGDITLFQDSFAYNRKKNYYIINRFDITPYIHDESFRMTIDERLLSAFLLFRFSRFNVIYHEDFCFVFFKDDCPIKKFTGWKDSMLLVVGSLFKLALHAENNREGGKREIIYRYLKEPGIELQYGSGRLSRSIPVTFEKGRWYEAVIDYRVSSGAKPVVLLTADPFSFSLPVIRGVLDNSLPDTARRAFVVFSPGADLVSPLVHLLLRGRRGPRDSKSHKETGIFFEKIIVYRYGEAPPGMSDLGGSSVAVTYADFFNKIRREFIEAFQVRL